MMQIKKDAAPVHHGVFIYFIYYSIVHTAQDRQNGQSNINKI